MTQVNNNKHYEFYLLIEASNKTDIIFPTNATDLAKVRSVLACKRKHSDLINIDDRWFEVQEKNDSNGYYETAVFDVTEHIIDPITGIFNFRYFKSLLIGYIEYALNKKEEFSVVMADVNRLRDINNTYGHQIGNQVLSGIGATLINSFRLNDPASGIIEKRKENTNPNNQKDIFARLHGDEFGILLTNISLEDSERKIETIGKSISDLSFDVNGIPINLASMSFGIFHVGEEYYKKGNGNPEKIAEDILKRADEKMYRNKGISKGRTYIFGTKPQQTE